MIQEHEMAVLTADIPSDSRSKGDVGTVVYVYEGGKGYEVEFVNEENISTGVTTVAPGQLRALNADNRIKQVYRSLAKVGISAKFLRDFVVPPTLQVEAGRSEGGLDRLAAYLSSKLSLTNEVRGRGVGEPLVHLQFVRNFDGSLEPYLAGAGQFVAIVLAHAALSGVSSTARVDLPAADDLRRQLLSTGKSYIAFEDLLAHCWSIGIPVLHAYHLPTNAQKSRGAAIELGGRSAIVLCYKHRSPSKQLTPLSHELGHIANHHFAFSSILSGIEHEVIFTDETELEAKRYATRLITGGNSPRLDPTAFRSGAILADEADRIGRRLGIDPGYLLNVEIGTHATDRRTIGAAMKIIDDDRDAIELMRRYMVLNLNGSRMSEEDRFLVSRIAGIRL